MLPADQDARLTALLSAIDPTALKGAIVRGRSPMLCEQWLQIFVSMMPVDAPFKRMPSNISDERLLGGLDFAATLSRGSSVCERGVLAMANGGAVVLSAATTRATTFTHIARVIDEGAVRVERDGFSETHETAFASVIVECADDEAAPAAIADRLAFVVELDATTRDAWSNAPLREIVVAARSRLSAIRHEDASLVALARGAARLGIVSPRAVLLALSVARAHAALVSHPTVGDDDLACAARLVLAPRALTLPDAERESSDEQREAERNRPTDASPNTEQTQKHEIAEAPRPERDANSPEPETDAPHTDQNTLTEIVVRAATAALPPGMLAAAAARTSGARGTVGRSGTEQQNGTRGRQIGIRRGEARGGARLDLVATLRASVPLQRVRREARTDGATRVVELRRDDFRIRRCATPTTTTTLFVVDASGSAALNRLAEAKGAVELLLAEGYARRDKVALIAFRGTVAELVLPATHALARARRAVAGMPAGGGTPLATALDLAATVIQQLRRDASQVVMVMLTDGRANVGRDGKGGRPRAEAEALEAATRVRALRTDVVWIDTSSRSEVLSRSLADAAGARYLLLPAANAHGMSQVALAARSA